MRKLTVYISFVFMFSCKLAEPIPNDLDSRINSQATLAKLLIETTNSIYKIDLVSNNTPIYIHALIIYFKHNLDSFSLELDSIYANKINDTIIRFQKVTVVKDSFMLSNLQLPYSDIFFKDNSYFIEAKSTYQPFYPFTINYLRLKCLFANYRFDSNFFKDTGSKFNKCVD